MANLLSLLGPAHPSSPALGQWLFWFSGLWISTETTLPAFRWQTMGLLSLHNCESQSFIINLFEYAQMHPIDSVSLDNSNTRIKTMSCSSLYFCTVPGTWRLGHLCKGCRTGKNESSRSGKVDLTLKDEEMESK